MEPNAILQSDPLDILFENRNKSYGAYPLRKYYAQRLYISMGTTLSLVTVLIFLYLHFQNLPLTTHVFEIPDPMITPIDLTPKPISPLPAPKPAAIRPPATIEHVTLVIVPDREVSRSMATTDELNTKAIGLTTTEGNADNGTRQTSGNTTTGSTIAADSAETSPEILFRADIMPEFPGGLEALKRYLLKNLRMPEDGMDAGMVVRVVARFVVDTDGHVRNIEITQAADAVFNTEVKRVINKMPDWKPGMQHQHPVAVYYSLPVNFVIGD